MVKVTAYCLKYDYWLTYFSKSFFVFRLLATYFSSHYFSLTTDQKIDPKRVVIGFDQLVQSLNFNINMDPLLSAQNQFSTFVLSRRFVN